MAITGEGTTGTTGGRTGSGGGSGGTTGGGTGQHAGICTISPSDLAANVDNLMSRLAALENELAQLKGTNIFANQLSDISQQVGWVQDITYLGTGGWTQTPAGTLIPPTGSGIHFVLTREGWGWYDTDGNLLMGGTSGAAVMSGSKVQEWDAAAAGSAVDYGFARAGGSSVRGVTIGTNSLGGSSIAGGVDMQVSRAGTYIISTVAHSTGGSSFGYGIVCLLKRNGATIMSATHDADLENNPDVTVSMSNVFELAANDVILYQISVVGGTASHGFSSLSVVRLSS